MSERDHGRHVGKAEVFRNTREFHRLMDTDVRYCMCVDPENCTSAVPDRVCKASHTIWEDGQAEPSPQKGSDSQSDGETES